LPFDERAPVHARDRAQAHDAVRHGDLGDGHPLTRANGGVLRAQAVFGQPLLEPGKRRERAVGEPDLLQEARDENGVERRMAMNERGQRVAERAPPLGVRGVKPRRPSVGVLDLVEALHRSKCHPPHIFDETEAKHCRHRP
jgi:hypothetical protein